MPAAKGLLNPGFSRCGKLPRFSSRRHRRLRGFGINFLRRAQSRSQFHATPNLEQDLLQRADRSDGIQAIVITKMRDAEELPLHLSLAIGDYGAKVVAECLHDIAGIDSVR